jgi:Calcineurin-like phosphoesterase
MKKLFCCKTAFALILAILIGFASASAEAWKFGVMSDTQWIGTDDGKNPNTVAVDIIKQLNQQFIGQGVKFVIQVGDLVDSYSTDSMATTAVFRQDLYNSGIGFYPLRGNHESAQAAASQFVSVFPQTQSGGNMNMTPSSAFAVTNPDSSTQPFPSASGSIFSVGTISSTPAAPTGFTGLCYAFDYENARFVLLDQFTPTTGTSHSILDDSQVTWMDGQLSGRPGNTHAFVFGHKGIITQNHTDGLFGLPSDQPTRTNNFVFSLFNHGVRYYMGGHDHMHNRAIVASPDSFSKVQNLVLASDSSKFYIPYGSTNFAFRTVNPVTKAVSTSATVVTTTADPTQTNDYIYNVLVAGGTTRETPISQELNTVGYYIFTVDGPKVTADFYSAVVNPSPVLSSGIPVEYLISAAPAMTFAKRESFGYSTNGQEFLVGQGASYAPVQDAFANTTARILSGINGSTAADSAGRALTKTVNTGWTNGGSGAKSDVLTLWGMTDPGATSTDTFTLSMSYDPTVVVNRDRINQGFMVALNTKDENGSWVQAVDKNNGGKKKFVLGPWNKVYPLGTYGVDPNTHTAWAVINHASQFAVMENHN